MTIAEPCLQGSDEPVRPNIVLNVGASMFIELLRLSRGIECEGSETSDIKTSPSPAEGITGLSRKEVGSISWECVDVPLMSGPRVGFWLISKSCP